MLEKVIATCIGASAAAGVIAAGYHLYQMVVALTAPIGVGSADVAFGILERLV